MDGSLIMVGGIVICVRTVPGVVGKQPRRRAHHQFEFVSKAIELELRTFGFVYALPLIP